MGHLASTETCQADVPQYEGDVTAEGTDVDQSEWLRSPSRPDATAWSRPGEAAARQPWRLAPPVHPPPGCGSLVFSRAGGRTLVSRALATSPLRLLTPGNHGHGAWVYTSTFGGGLVDGDAIDLRVDVGDDATALLSTQASTKVYRSAQGTATRLSARIGRGGLFVLTPDPLVGFQGSRYRQVQEFDVAKDGSLVVVDWATCGRRAFGERWAFLEYASRLVVRLDGDLMVHDVVALRAADGDVGTRMGRFDVFGLVLLVGPAGAAATARILAARREAPVTRGAEELVAVAPIGDRGCLVRFAGTSVERTGLLIRRLLDFVPARLGDDPWSRRA